MRTNFLFGALRESSFWSCKLPRPQLPSLPLHDSFHSTTTMKYLASLLVLLPLATAEVTRLKLHKIPQVSQNPALETAYLASKYGVAQPQSPLMGAGGSGRRLRVDNQDDGLFWTQEEATKDGHTVPLTSTSLFVCPNAM